MQLEEGSFHSVPKVTVTNITESPTHGWKRFFGTIAAHDDPQVSALAHMHSGGLQPRPRKTPTLGIGGRAIGDGLPEYGSCRANSSIQAPSPKPSGTNLQ